MLLAFSMCLGCQNAASRTTVWEKWALREGGFASQSVQERAQAALNALQYSSSNARVYVLESPSAAAYAWPDGSIFLTSALLDMLESQEIAAVIAHELGHLCDRPRPGDASALLGKAQHLDDESRADEFACDLLRRSGLAPLTLASALRKVQLATGISDRQRKSILDRVSRITSRLTCP
jgi:Zn-dependent protease with chaperone function